MTEMDGYVVADPGTDPEAVFNQPGVRHVAILETGELLAAFEGDQPCAGQLLLNSDEALPWWWHKVRTVQPSGPEAFYLFTSEGFDKLKMGVIAAASRLHTGNVLVQTNGEELEGAIWGSVAVRYLDERLVSA